MRVTPSLIVRLVQINQPLLKQNYLPYAAGLLQAYVQRHAPDLSRYVFFAATLPALAFAGHVKRAAAG
jgi:hypothetical protein